MKFHFYLLSTLMLLQVYSCKDEHPTLFDAQLQQLEGEWEEAPGIGYREIWKRSGNKMIGAGYMLAGETAAQVEKLKITISDSTLIYHAIVFDQNAGKQIDFPLNNFSDSTLEFANPNHDFPNLIGYYFANDTTLQIRVESLTDSTAGFELHLKKCRSLK